MKYSLDVIPEASVYLKQLNVFKKGPLMQFDSSHAAPEI